MVTIVTQLYHSPVSVSFRRLFESGYEIMVLTTLPAKSVSNAMFCLQSYQGLVITKSLVY